VTYAGGFRTGFRRCAVFAVLTALTTAGCTADPDRPGPAPPSAPGPAPAASGYPEHRDIIATVFWVGEPAGRDNDYIGNAASAWDENWQQHFGGVDDPADRQHDGYWPAGFTPGENPFYFALPYGEFTDSGAVRRDVSRVYWYDPASAPKANASILRTRWVRITLGDRTAYAQWSDVGPYEADDVDYVFGRARPTESRAGIDLSPATARYLGVAGSARVAWQFVDAGAVPAGPWTEIVTPPGRPGGPG
jgi:hypothetical protein